MQSAGQHAGAQLAADALLHPVLVAVEDVAAVLARLLRALLLGVLPGDRRTAEVLEGQLEPAEEVLPAVRSARGWASAVTSFGGRGGAGCSARFQRRSPTWGTTARSSRGRHRRRRPGQQEPAATTAAAMPTPHQPSTTKPATMSSQPSDSGIRRFHPRSMSWS